jgi:hypothetical protein
MERAMGLETGEKILAKSLFKELKSHGYSGNAILALTNELLDLVTIELHDNNTAAARALETEEEHLKPH